MAERQAWVIICDCCGKIMGTYDHQPEPSENPDLCDKCVK